MIHCIQCTVHIYSLYDTDCIILIRPINKNYTVLYRTIQTLMRHTEIHGVTSRPARVAKSRAEPARLFLYSTVLYSIE